MIVLDTHALVWWVSGDAQLSEGARATIDEELARDDGLVLVSAISVWEIALLVQKERLVLSMSVDDWVANASAIEGLQIVPVDAHLAIESTRLPGRFHQDPADRLIVALAMHEGAPLVTADSKILSYGHIRTIQADR